MKNIEEKLAKVEADKKELEKAIKLVKEEEARLLALKEEQEKKKEHKILTSFYPTAENVAAVVKYIQDEGRELIKEKVVSSLDTWLDGFSYERGTEFSFGDWTFENHVRYGGSEGMGEEHYIVIKVSNKNGQVLYFKVPGYYASYDGAHLDFDYITEVKPVEKPVIFWE